MSGFLKPGDMFLEYRLLVIIGVGGMGIVFKAVHEEYNDYVAIKFLSPKHAMRKDFAARFTQECKIYPQLKHENIVRMRRAGVAQVVMPAATPSAPPPPVSVAFIVMDLLEGQTVRKILSKFHRLDYLNTLHVMGQIAEAMRVAHSKKIVHRDLKPENIMVGTMGDEKGWVWIMDFGIAKAGDGGMNTDEMPDMGTARYMAPEQIRNIFNAGKKGLRVDLDGRIDIYAFGVIFYEVITGQHIFLNDKDKDHPPSFQEMLQGHLVAEPTPAHQLVPEPEVECLWPIIAKCLAIDPAKRYQSFDDILHDLQGLIRKSVPPTHVVAKRAIAQRTKAERKAAFAALPAQPSEEVPVEPSGREALPPEPPEPSGREALAPEPPKHVADRAGVLAETPPQPTAPPQAEAPAELAPTVPAALLRIEVPLPRIEVAHERIEVGHLRIEVPTEEQPETTADDTVTEPQGRPTLDLLNFVPKANPLPFVPPAAPFVPAVPLLQPELGKGYTTKMQRPEIPTVGGTPKPPQLAKGYTTKMQRPEIRTAGGNPQPPRLAAPAPPVAPKFGLPPPTLSAQQAFGLPAPPLPPWMAAAAARVDASWPVATPATASPMERPRVADTPIAAAAHQQPAGPALPNASTSPRPTPRTPANMTTPASVRRSRRHLILAPIVGLAIVVAGSAAFFFIGARGRSARTLAEPVAVQLGASAAAVAAPAAPPHAVSPAATATAPTAAAPPADEAPVHPDAPPGPQEAAAHVPVPVASAPATHDPVVQKPPKSPQTPQPVARRPLSRTPVMPLVGD